MKRNPKKLEVEPLIEAICEVRFSCNDVGASKLLPGLLSSSLNGRYQAVKQLPIAELPSRLLEQDNNLRYAPTLSMTEGNLTIHLGDRVLSVHSLKPYIGWTKFLEEIKTVFGALEKSKLITTVECLSLKYINIFEETHLPAGLCDLNLAVYLSGRNMCKEKVQLRISEACGDFTCEVTVVSPVQAKLAESASQLQGVLVDIELRATNKLTWNILEERLNELHSIMKEKFFALLTEQSLKNMEPTY